MSSRTIGKAKGTIDRGEMVMCIYESYEALKKRFNHLLESKTIAKYDEWDSWTREYKRDITELDKTMQAIEANIKARTSTEEAASADATTIKAWIPNVILETYSDEDLELLLVAIMKDAVKNRPTKTQWDDK